MTKRRKLTPKQAKFVREYLKDSNGKAAAIRAGYAEGSAKVTGSRLLTNANVKALLANHQQEAESLAVVDKAWVLERLRENVDRSMTTEPVRDRDGNETGDYTYQGNVANRALELLGKDLGMFADKMDVKVQGAVEEMLESVRGEMTADAFAELVGAIKTRMGAEAGGG